MPQLLFAIVLAVLVFGFIPGARRVVTHRMFLRGFFFFMGTLAIILAVALAAVYAWYEYQKRESERPHTTWEDETIFQDLTPVTPKTGNEVYRNEHN